ncbi:MAG TPA: acetyl-CoA carboxylase biotin carboxyl carrier protein [Vicinamibacterales bacterium]|nr:acetyl-CoA carboxylase biotin carboxyl carrier protein [Vicinamibacterales bacterium]
MNLDDINKILDLMREHDLAEFELERDGLKIRVRKGGQQVTVAPAAMMPVAMPAAQAVPMAAVPQPAAAAPAVVPMDADGVDLAVIKSPIVGTFYRSSEPGARAFVEVGDQVKRGQVLCIIEAMKLMNEIESDCDGELSAVYVENGKPVQFGDRLFAVKIS